MVGVVCTIESRRTKNTKTGSRMAFLTIEDMTASMSVLVFPKVFQEYGNLLTEGSIVYLTGKLSVSEEEAPTILCESVYTPAELQGMESIKSQRNRNSGVQPVNSSQLSVSQPNTTKRYGLYIKVSNQEDPLLQKSLNLISIFEGQTPVYVYFEDNKKYTCAPKHLWTTLNNPLLKELKLILGEDRVVVRLPNQ